MTRPKDAPLGKPKQAPLAGSFGDQAAEMANEPFETVAAQPPQEPTDAKDDISGIAEMIEEGAPLEPADLADDVGEAAPTDEVSAEEMAQRVKELTTDLQRLQAEYVNYKRRVDRDRELRAARTRSTPSSPPCCPVLDDIDRAREHEELDGGLQGDRRVPRADRVRRRGAEA